MANRVLSTCAFLVLTIVCSVRPGEGLKCVCNSSECEVIKPKQCPGRGLIVLDPCECCWVCARTLGEPCGGPGGFSGRCEPPYHCLESPTRNVGVCQRLPSEVRNSNKNCSHMQLIQGGCGIVERKCVCEFRPSLLCTDDPTRWYYRDNKECQYNLQAIIQQELEAENQETISGRCKLRLYIVSFIE
ncbi:cysteine-rich motor neuron 1 protein-like [Ctenocephalides felis]|uniref:cysteine-rich motor neuron 1 protein-like n=1 Tax=Ctenocephalides felis TaxID=7515 RepID=UPI000E6E4130|nr:cysteine-rich motor neuron 1 protein-like [Ctenocephalides felis]